MRMELIIRFDYGSIVPWVRHDRDGLLGGRRPGRALHSARRSQLARRGPDAPSREFDGRAGRARAVRARPGTRRTEPLPEPVDAEQALDGRPRRTGASGRAAARYDGEWRDAVHPLAASRSRR